MSSTEVNLIESDDKEYLLILFWDLLCGLLFGVKDLIKMKLGGLLTTTEHHCCPISAKSVLACCQ